jgi:hypothetical protein
MASPSRVIVRNPMSQNIEFSIRSADGLRYDSLVLAAGAESQPIEKWRIPASTKHLVAQGRVALRDLP